jgi:ABC-type dipeptide/oligopeptide/nickel transport system permease component
VAFLEEVPLLRFIAQRLLLSVLTLFIVSLVVFAGVELLPGDLADAFLGREATPTRLETLRAQLGLDRPALERYLHWLGDAVQGDLGVSLARRAPIAELIRLRLRNTLLLGFTAALVGLPLALVLGTIGGLTRDRKPDLWISTVALILMNIVLPAVALIFVMVAHNLRMVRTNVIDVMASDYVQMAILKGVPRARVVLRHALPNALLPTINLVALYIAWLVGGVVIIEQVFNYPGIGTLMIQAVHDRDIPLVQGVILVIAGGYVVLNLDVFSRVLMGGRIALVVTLSAGVLAITWGGLLGMVLAYLGGVADEVPMRIVDALLSLPSLFIYLLVISALGTSSTILIIMLAITAGISIIRITRGATLGFVARDFITAARARGESTRNVILRELLPNVLDVLLVEGAMRWSWMLLAFSSLSFLGFGVTPPTPDWGLMIAENRRRLAFAPWASIFPMISLGTLVIGINLAADALAKAIGLDRSRDAPV